MSGAWSLLKNSAQRSEQRLIPSDSPVVTTRDDWFARTSNIIFQQATHGILLLDAHTVELLAANDAFLNLAACSLFTVIGKPLWELPLFEALDISREIVELLKSRGIVQYDEIAVESNLGHWLILDINFQLY